MIGLPPLDNPLCHVNPIELAEVTAALFAKLIGASGKNTIAVPSPGGDASDSPYELIAITLMKIRSPRTIE